MYSLWRMLLIWFWLRSRRDNHKIKLRDTSHRRWKMLLSSLSLSSNLQFGLYKVVVIAQVVIKHVKKCPLAKNIKIEKASKSSYFRPDNQRQMTLDLSPACRYRMRLISLISWQNLLEIMWSARCEYSKCMSFAPRLLIRSKVSLYAEGSVPLTGGECPGNQRGVPLSVPYTNYMQIFRKRRQYQSECESNRWREPKL